MAKLSPKQFNTALAGAVLITVLVLAALGGWLYLNRDITAQKRALQTPSVTAWLPGQQPQTPPSWQKPQVAAPVEEPAAPQNVSVDNNLPPETSDAMPPALPPAELKPAATETPPASPQTTMAKWQKNARAFNQNDKRPRIAIVVADLGLAAAVADAAIQTLPADISLTFTSLAPDLENWLVKAKAAGHETLLSIPMEPENYPQNDPGPNPLLVSLSKEENVARLRTAMAKAGGYVAVTPSMGEKFVTAEDKLTPVLGTVKDEGVMFLDSTLNKDSLVASLSRLGKVSFARGDQRLDAAMSSQPMAAQLDALEKIARDKGSAVAILTPYPERFIQIKDWAATLDRKGLVLAPLTALNSDEMPVAPTANPQ